ncbi:PcfJ domain-containing protein [Caminibacter mediatlanticus]|nr:PcfJ domain-containing protein [Caminibacter mediatlanticus]
MKSFVVDIPKSPSNIINHYLCECGNRFINKNRCPKCGNDKFFTYKDVKNLNKELFEIKNNECIIEYPVVFNQKIKIEKKVFVKKYDKLIIGKKEKVDNETLAYIIKLFLITQNEWKSKRKYFYKLQKQNLFNRLLYLPLKLKDPEMLLWYIFHSNITKEEYFNKLLKNEPKSIKKAVFKNYKKQISKGFYNQLIDYFLIKVFKNIDYKREMINFFSNNEIDLFFTYESIDSFIKFLKNYDDKKIFKFLKKYYQDLTIFINRYLQHNLTPQKEIIDSFYNINPINYNYNFPIQYKYKKFIIKLPKNSIELVEYSKKLRNCLSNYTHIHNSKSLIFGIFINNKIKYAVNFDKNQKEIIEAKGFANSEIPKNDFLIIKEFFSNLNIA